MAPTSARIFINYRRADSAGWARELHRDLGDRFSSARVFRDIEMEPGIDFVEHIEQVMDACEVCIVVIGARWTTVTNDDGRRRLDDPRDLVCLEIAHALQRPDVNVIPVLVDGARMPGTDELPPSLRPLARINACELTDTRWDFDIERLCGHLRNVLGESTTGIKAAQSRGTEQERRPTQAPSSPTLGPALATLAAALCAGVVAAALSSPLAGGGDGTHLDRVLSYALERGVLWAIFGAAVAAVVAATFTRALVPLSAALVGAGAGWLGGAVGGVANIAMQRFGSIDGTWLLSFVVIALPGMLLARVLARSTGAREGDCVLAALAGAALAALMTPDDRTLRLTLHALIVGGAIVAVLAAPSRRALAPDRRAAISRGGAAG